MADLRTLLRSTLQVLAVSSLWLAGAGCPKPPPPKLPPKEVPRVNQLIDSTGERQDVIADAVQAGSNQARITYNCGAPHSQGVDGKDVLNVEASKCEFNPKEKTLVLSNGSATECPTFLLTITDYKGPGTYNTSALGKISLGTAKLRQPICKWEGSLCMDWNGAAGPHPDASCTIEVGQDGGLQYGTGGATITGTFVCDNFTSPYKGCAGSPAKASCVVSRASFSIAGCAVTSSAVAPAAGGGKTKPGPTGKRPR